MSSPCNLYQLDDDYSSSASQDLLPRRTYNPHATAARPASARSSRAVSRCSSPATATTATSPSSTLQRVDSARRVTLLIQPPGSAGGSPRMSGSGWNGGSGGGSGGGGDGGRLSPSWSMSSLSQLGGGGGKNSLIRGGGRDGARGGRQRVTLIGPGRPGVEPPHAPSGHGRPGRCEQGGAQGQRSPHVTLTPRATAA